MSPKWKKDDPRRLAAVARGKAQMAKLSPEEMRSRITKMGRKAQDFQVNRPLTALELEIEVVLKELGVPYEPHFRSPTTDHTFDFLLAGNVDLECDEAVHDATVEYDTKRDALLLELGYRVIRVRAAEDARKVLGS